MGKDISRDHRFFRYIRNAVFIGLLVMEIFVFFLSFRTVTTYVVPRWILILCVEVLFTGNNIIKIFILSKFEHKVVCYIIDFLSQFVLTMLTGSDYLCYIYVLILTEYYISTLKMRDRWIMGLASLITFVLTYGLCAYYLNGTHPVEIIASCLGELLILTLHFCLVNFALFAYDSRQETAKALSELDESNRKLQQAYDELTEVTVLQERQRIAKDIHDTAGHSITTVIMQTEAAKLVIDEDPQDAKRRIIAANLQAKNALEELRRSVHLLAGNSYEESLRDALERVVRDTCDGTDIIIRDSVEDVVCREAKRRFLTNTLKEGISNGLRHGGATAFFFELEERDGEIKFLLSDNGTGVDVSVLQPGFGLKSMQNSVDEFGGRVAFSSEPGEGFEICIYLPSDSSDAEGSAGERLSKGT